jgi:copper chaperone CopZ
MTQTLEIGGMSCGHCLRAVRDALSEMPSVTLAEVRIGKAVRGAGYDVLVV